MNLSKIKKAYFIGLKGVGMTALAQVLKGRGIEVLGSDTSEKFFTDEVLDKFKIKVFEGFSPKNIPPDIDLIVASSAYGPTNPEIKFARQRGQPVYSYSDILTLLLNKSYGLAVAGTHGKTTTTAMLGRVLEGLGLDPTVIVGSKVLEWGSNARISASLKEAKFLVAELDEYQGKFLKCRPKILVLTNIEYDHPDFFKSFKDYKSVFFKLVSRLPKDGLLIGFGDDRAVREIMKKAPCRTVAYGQKDLKKIGWLSLKIPGEHNQLNALAVLTLVEELIKSCGRLNLPHQNVGGSTSHIAPFHLDPMAEAKKILEEFQGTARRFEIKGKLKNGILLIDDYAHHPTEIRATLKAARELYSQRRIWCVFQPHTFTRTEVLLKDFSRSFKAADKVIVLDIYGSAREKKGRVHSRDLVDLMFKYQKPVKYISNILGAADYLKTQLKRGDIVMTMGAGDVWKLSIYLQGRSPSG